MAKWPGYTIIVHRDGALDSRQFHLPGWLLRTTTAAASVALVAVAIIVAIYGPIVGAAARLPFVEREVRRLRDENTRVNELARLLDEAEARYAHLRGMLGADVALPDPGAAARAVASGEERLFVAPAIFAREPSVGSDTSLPTGPSIPRRWPLTVASYRTRGLAQGLPGVESHAGIDLAVPEGSDVRASGGGTVLSTGTDSAYGLYVLLQHPDGYETMYGHLSRVLVRRGDQVLEGRVIALTGNTGRSTAPHLHFEIRRNGRSVDPLTLVREGS
ncbi:MAG TPA: M23 family metallopeptidase [Gemmatimonadales bacterium]|nr:M23 family metallopeptidase [Gemmatimonadales bacterium]